MTARPTDCFPQTAEQKEATLQAFIDSIDPNAICELASLYRDSKPCRIFQDTANGSFNACFFVEFPEDKAKWVVRIPIAPLIYDVWGKVQSEVATMRYLEKIKIPIPHIHGFGPAGPTDKRNPTGLAHIVLDYVHGQSLDILALITKSRERRNRFYSQLIDILAELWQQEFDQAGSLMPDPSGGPIPVIGPSLSLQLNELQVDQGSEGIPATSFHSAMDFALYQYQLLDQRYRLPISEMSVKTARLEVFGLNDLKQRISSCVDPDDRGPFVLAHTDLRWSNIIVDEDLEIRGIIDWEWTSTIPRQFFTPPTWIAGQSPEYATGTHYRDEYRWFYKILLDKAATSEPCRQLAEAWGRGLPKQASFALATLLRHHDHFLDLYFNGVFPHFNTSPLAKTLTQFFACDGGDTPFTLDVEQRLQNSERYPLPRLLHHSVRR